MLKNIVLLVFFSLFLFSMNIKEEPNKVLNNIEWISMEEVQDKINQEPRKIIIDVYTDWCGWCKRMDNTTFSHRIITGYINEKYYAVKLDAEHKENISIGNKTYKYVAQGRRGYHELAAMLLNGNMSYPSLVFLDENLGKIQVLAGYQTPDSLDPILRFFGDNAYKEKSWENFRKTYHSPFQD